MLLSILGVFLTSCTNTTFVMFDDGRIEEVYGNDINCDMLKPGDSVVIQHTIPSTLLPTIYGKYIGTVPESYSLKMDSTTYYTGYYVAVVIEN